jgi:endonuclease IV
MSIGVQNAINNALHIGGNSFALFLKSQRKWSSPPLAPEARDQFKAFCEEHKYDAAKHVLPHGSYLVKPIPKRLIKLIRVSWTTFNGAKLWVSGCTISIPEVQEPIRV